MSDCSTPLLIYIAFVLIVVGATFKSTQTWDWVAVGYALIGFIIVFTLCFFQLSTAVWTFVLLPIFIVIVAIVWRIFYHNIENYKLARTQQRQQQETSSTTIAITTGGNCKCPSCGCA